MGPSGPDGRFISLRAPSFTIKTQRRIYNTIKEGQFFWPMYQYLLPYVASLKVGPSATWGPVNQVVDYMISNATPIFHQVTGFRTNVRISHITSNVAQSAGASEVDTVAGNNSPYLNIGRDTINLYKSIGVDPTVTQTTPWSESALAGNNIWGCMHNGGVYTTGIAPAGSNAVQLQEFGSQGPYSMFGEVQTLQSGAGSSYHIANTYHSPDGHAFSVPSMKSILGTSAASTLPLCNVRLPFPSGQVTPVNTSNTAVGPNPPTEGDTIVRTAGDIAVQNLNHGGEAICLWVNPLNPDLDAGATTSQKLQISFVMEMEIEMDVKINYNPTAIAAVDAPLYTDGVTQGKVAAMPCQNIPTTVTGAYWIYGDALRPTHRNLL
jgi:hypothetical protein